MPNIAILDNLLVAESLAHALGAVQGITVVCAVEDIGDLATVVATQPVDVVLVDVAMDNAIERQQVCELPEIKSGAVPALFLARSILPAFLESTRSLAAGFLLKSSPVSAVADAITVIAAGGTVFDNRLMLPEEERASRPSPRELELIHALSQGMANIAIAHSLNISQRTVESHLRRLFARYEVSNRSELLMLAIREGWINPHDEEGAT